MLRRAALLATLAALVAAGSAQAAGPTLRAGAGRADSTPPTGYYMFGWVRSDAQSTGQHTRLFARVIVLERGGKKVALMAADLGGIAGGALKAAAEMNKDRGFSEKNVILSASHTHASPTGWFNFGAYNTVFMTAEQPTEFNTAADPQLYAFMVRRFALALRRADDDLAPARLGWATGRLTGITRNRSIEAHLANHGIEEEFGEGSVAQDPKGYPHTIDPEVTVLRVDKLGPGKTRMRRPTPIGMWSTFADHGTVNKYTFHYYNRDHHGSATHVVERRIRRSTHVPRTQEVVNAYGNTDEGDQSAGLDRGGPAAADFVGRVEARVMMQTWRRAGKDMTRRPQLDSRWTRVCFCGQDTDAGPVDSEPAIGLPLLTGSEEGRGPLYDETHVPFEGRRKPVPFGPQGYKIGVAADTDNPKAVPLVAMRVRDKVVVTIPGEMTVGMGERVRAAVRAAGASGGVRSAVISGLANEFLQYFTTPEEYDRQHYEGGSMLYGRAASNLLKMSLVDLTKALTAGKPAPAAYPYDPRNGMTADAEPFGPGAGSAAITGQPSDITRLKRAAVRWRGGPRGLDRPLDRSFVSVERRTKKGWKTVDDDLGLRVLWEVDDDGNYRALWEAHRSATTGTFRFRITGNRYGLVSKTFEVARSRSLVVRRVGGKAAVKLSYPPPVPEVDLTYRPPVKYGTVAFMVGGKQRVVRSRTGVFGVSASGGERVVVPAGAARDRWGNTNAKALVVRP
jgi:hypothetical protein